MTQIKSDRAMEIFAAFILLALFGGVIAYTQVVGPQGIYDFGWINGTSANVDTEYYRAGQNYTDWIVNVTGSRGIDNAANGGNIAHGLSGIPTEAQLTVLNTTYDGVLTLVYWDWAATDATNISIDLYWTNGTAIADALTISWRATYEP